MKNTRVMRGLVPLFFLSILIMFSSGCRREIKPDMNLLSSQIALFNRFLIWQKYADAEKMVTESLISRIEADSRLKRYTEIKIIRMKPLNNNPFRVRVILRREYYMLNDNTVRKEIVEQLWKFDKEANQWILVSEKKL